MAHRAVLVTGATSGLGEWLVPRLAEAGLTVLVHGRDPLKVQRVVESAGGRAEGFVADLASLDECRRLAADLAGRSDLRILVNNAGVGFGAPGAGRELSRDGFELRWAVNYLAPVAIARGLVATLRANAPSHIVNVGSVGQYSIDFDNLRMDHGYDGRNAYRRAKLALAAWSLELADELGEQGVRVDCIHPASLMDTAMVREGQVAPMSTVDEGGAATLQLVLDGSGAGVDSAEPAPSGARGTGRFFNGTHVASAHPDAYDPKVRAQLREVTDDALG